jgi:hypothetical protein
MNTTIANNPRTVLERIYNFLIEPDECRCCGRSDAFDCNENELCGRAKRALTTPRVGIAGLLREIIKTNLLSDSRGDESGGHLLAEARAVLRKPLLVPLRRSPEVGVTDDPQYSPYFPSEKYVVFSDYNHPEGHLASRGFRTKREAEAFCDVKKCEAQQAAPPKREVICPKTRRCKGDVVGCGSSNVRWDASEKVYDCLDCGIWFTPRSAGRKRRK